MRISVITPTLDERQNIPTRAREIAGQEGGWEWIVADGGSSDDTIALAAAAGARIVRCGRGRGRQLAAGARVATGDILVFLHADTELPCGAFAAIRGALAQDAIVGGNFRLRFDEPTRTARFFATMYHLQQIVTRTYYGDSVIFVRRAVYDAIGGFADLPIMEDYAFVRALERYGAVTCIPLFVITSARRFRGRPMRTLLRWFSLLVLYRLGVSPHQLVRFYQPHGQPRARRG